MADHWIVSSFNFVKHATLENAQAEMARLQTKVPEKTFQIFRIKSRLRRSNAEAVIKRLQTALADVIVAERAGTKLSRAAVIVNAERVLHETDFFTRCPDDRTPTSAPAVSPEPNLNPKSPQQFTE